MTTTEPVTAPASPSRPQPIADDTWLIPNLVPSGPGAYLFVNSMVILAEEPVVVDKRLIPPSTEQPTRKEHDDASHPHGGGRRAPRVRRRRRPQVPAGAQPKPRIEWSHRRLVGTEGFVEVRLGTEGRAHLFAIDT